MATDAIDPFSDSRIVHCKAEVNGKTYHYLLGQPKGDPRATLILIHGFPDLSMGWRNQIPMFIQMGYRVVVPDMMGYGGTDAPKTPPESLSFYSMKRAASDIKELARQLGAPKIMLGGHDWGAMCGYRTVLWNPDFVTHFFSVCVPYMVPSKGEYVPLETLIETNLPNFRYQLQFRSGEVEENIISKEQIRQFLNGLYGGKGPAGETGFSVEEGVQFKNLPSLGPTPLMSSRVLDYYTEQWARTGVHGPLNWYRAHERNHQEELKLEKTTIEIPVLFIQASRDAALPPALSAGMQNLVPNMTKKEVDTRHWALWEAPEQVNGLIKGWLEEVTNSTKSTL